MQHTDPFPTTPPQAPTLPTPLPIHIQDTPPKNTSTPDSPNCPPEPTASAPNLHAKLPALPHSSTALEK
eukprot:2892715-Rhodomonas_salina.1